MTLFLFMKLSAIKPLHIQKLYDSMLKNGYEKNGKQYSYNPNTVKRVHQIISSSLNTAVYWQLIDDNPCKSFLYNLKCKGS